MAALSFAGNTRYSFMPAELMVCITLLWVIKYTRMGGIIRITVAAMDAPARRRRPPKWWS